MTKLKQKVSDCLRTLTGAHQFCAIRSYLSTAAKHDLGFFNALIMLTEGRPSIPPQPYPRPMRHLWSGSFNRGVLLPMLGWILR